MSPMERSDKVRLRLYVTGQTLRSRRAIARLRELCDREFGAGYELVVVDVVEQPELAEGDKIVATPTLIKELPPPVRRIIGDLSDSETVLLGLDLPPGGRAAAARS